jgi:hypothetical protein
MPAAPSAAMHRRPEAIEVFPHSCDDCSRRLAVVRCNLGRQSWHRWPVLWPTRSMSGKQICRS